MEINLPLSKLMSELCQVVLDELENAEEGLGLLTSKWGAQGGIISTRSECHRACLELRIPNHLSEVCVT